MRTVTETMACLVLLVTGGAIYLLLRPTNLLMFKVVDGMGLSHDINRYREMTEHVCVPEFVVYCLPNGLWAAAYILLIDGLLHHQSKKVRMIAAAVIPLVGTTAELLQATGWLPGTFDYGDLLCLLLPLLAYELWLASYRPKTSLKIII